ncbi:MAG: ATP synthase F1 subunit delta [Myxococcales bacterium]|jgi:F-type H+-transporting ATPase subunit delta|nr:ATP synthase F1 subunit delta [Myxococcales bacterium]
MSYDAIGRRYAQAIFEIGKEEGNALALADQIQDFAKSYSDSDELKTVLENPMVPEATRESIVLELAQKCGASASAQKALRVVTRRRRLRALPDIARHLRRLCDEDARVVRAEVISAGPLGDGYLGRLKAELERATGQKVVLSHSVDAALIGGVITRIGDRVIDGSLRSRLATLREAALTN